MLQVERVYVEGIDQIRRVLHPHAGAVKVDQHPLVRIEVERVRHLDAVKEGPGLKKKINIISSLIYGENIFRFIIYFEGI